MKKFVNFPKVLLARSVRDTENGPARLLIPGINFIPFGDPTKLVLGSYHASLPVFLKNLCSKSDIYSTAERMALDANPALRGDIIAYLAAKQCCSSLETEVSFSGEIIGLISNGLRNNSKLFEEASDRNLRAFVLENGALNERMLDGSFLPAKFAHEILSFDTRVQSPEELERQSKHLEQNYRDAIDLAAKDVTLSNLLLFQNDWQKASIINPINFEFWQDSFSRALATNPQFRQELAAHRKEKELVKKNPDTVVQKREGESVIEAGSVFHDGIFNSRDFD